MSLRKTGQETEQRNPETDPNGNGSSEWEEDGDLKLVGNRGDTSSGDIRRLEIDTWTSIIFSLYQSQFY